MAYGQQQQRGGYGGNRGGGYQGGGQRRQRDPHGPCSKNQADWLAANGFNPNASFGQASATIDAAKRNHWRLPDGRPCAGGGRVTEAQAGVLINHGYDPAAFVFETASAKIDQIKANGWERPQEDGPGNAPPQENYQQPQGGYQQPPQQQSYGPPPQQQYQPQQAPYQQQPQQYGPPTVPYNPQSAAQPYPQQPSYGPPQGYQPPPSHGPQQPQYAPAGRQATDDIPF